MPEQVVHTKVLKVSTTYLRAAHGHRRSSAAAPSRAPPRKRPSSPPGARAHWFPRPAQSKQWRFSGRFWISFSSLWYFSSIFLLDAIVAGPGSSSWAAAPVCGTHAATPAELVRAGEGERRAGPTLHWG